MFGKYNRRNISLFSFGSFVMISGRIYFVDTAELQFSIFMFERLIEGKGELARKYERTFSSSGKVVFINYPACK